MRLDPLSRARLNRLRSEVGPEMTGADFSATLAALDFPELTAKIEAEIAARPPEPKPAPLPPQEPRVQPIESVYIARCGSFVKIGVSFDVHKRLYGLRCTIPHDVELLHILPGGRPFERRLHEVFAEYRHRFEWFREEGELAEWIDAGCPLA